MIIRIHKFLTLKFISILFIVFCMVPFVFPNPIVNTDMQPYSVLLGCILIIAKLDVILKHLNGRNWFFISAFTCIIAVIAMIISGINMFSIRGLYNYVAIFSIPCATIVALNELGDFPEKCIKRMILLWFIVSTIQFFLDRDFASFIIAGARTSYDRGVFGLASEPSFFGIACFYFLNLVNRFNKNKFLYSCILIIMGCIYAQSATGIIFIAGYFFVYLFDIINDKKGLFIWAISFAGIFIFLGLLETKFSGTRFAYLFDNLSNDGIYSILMDASVKVRLGSITDALYSIRDNMLLPGGFGTRIGSAYAGVVVELGFLGIPILLFISTFMSKTFSKLRTQILYFIVVTLLLFNNTQIGNPLLLLVVGINMYYSVTIKGRINYATYKES